MSELLESGQIFAGRYRIEKFLARGGFGAVYVAEQTETELRVALKVLFPHVLHSKDSVEKFKLEARVAGRVGSEHIVKVFDAGLDERTQMPFLVMELLDGRTLEDIVVESGPLPPSRVLAYLAQVASALDKAHGYVDRDGSRRPIVHRDLKPENLFLCSRETGDPIVKILDFGIAKVLSDSTKVSQEVKGTPLYMAYEQASAGKITPQTDIWALGLIAFFLLTGRSYWKVANAPDASLTQLFGEVLALPIDAPSQRAAEIGAPFVPPASFDAWFAKAVNRDPAARFATAGECARALATALGDGTTPRAQNTADAFAATSFDASSEPTDAAVGVPGAAAARSAGLARSTGASLAVGGTQRIEPPKRKPAVAAAIGVGVVLIGAAGVVGIRMAATSGVARESSSSPVPASSIPAVASAPLPAAPLATAPVITTPSTPEPSAAPSSGATPAAPRRQSGVVSVRKKNEPAAAEPQPPAPAAKPAKTSDTYTDR